MLVNPIILLLSAAAGFALCRAGGFNPHVHDMVLAGGICLIAGTLAMIPLALLRPESKPVEVYQATFLGTAIHLGFCVVLAVVAVFVLSSGPAFVWWLLAMFWLTLLAQSAVFVKRMRAPVAGGPAGTNPH